MALVLADRVLETTTTAGSGTITLAGAEPGYQSFSAVGDGNQTYYTITADVDWEVGIGTYTASGTTLSRDTVLSSSASGAKVTFPAGVKKVFVTYPSEKSVNLDVSGNINLSSAVISGVASPSADSDAATKLYVDTLAAQGITYHTPVKYEVPNTTGNLTATYNNGTAGVSATLTNAGTLAAFVPDGVTASISDRVLIYNQTNGFENGVYTVTVVGNGSTAWVLTRATDADTYALKSPNGLGGGDAFYVTSGNTGAGETYLCNNSGVITFGSTAISFVQISAAQVYSAGNGISLTNTVISLATPVAVGNGGTGSSATPTNGQLLIGNGSNFTLSTLTAGSGVSITNSAGSITLSATGLGGTVTAVTATGPLASSGGTTPDISIANSTGTGSVVLDQGATISSATITAALSASITTITGSSANITTVTGTTAGFSSAAITQLSGTSAGITTVSGTTTTFSSGTITQFGATSATIATVSGTNATYSNGSFTSATVTTVSGTTATYTSATVTNLNVTSVTLSNLSIASANITTLTGTNLTYTSGTVTNLNSTSANITTLTGTTFGTTATTQLRGASAQITTLSGTTATIGMFQYPSTTANSLTWGATAGQILRNESAEIAIGLSNSSPYALYLQGRYNNNTSRDLTINALGGNVGIGTASPVTRLHVLDALSGGQLIVANSETNAAEKYGTFATQHYTNAEEPALGFAVQSTSADNNILIGGALGEFNAATTVRFYTAANNTTVTGTERMRIDSSGNVGIGTATTTNGNLTVQKASATTDGPVLTLWNSNASAGNTCGYLRFFSNTTVRAELSSVIDSGGPFAGNFIFKTGENTLTERMRITSAGLVGIGTASPSTALQVSGTITTTGLTVSNTIAGSINGNAATVTDGMYLSSTQTSSARKLFAGSQNVGSMLTATGSLGGLEAINPGGANAAFMSFHRQGAYASYFGIDTDNNFAVGGWSAGPSLASMKVGSFGVGTAASGSSGEIRATNNITAYYSDARLKDFKGKIDGALDKVSQLNGYYYTENAKAEEFGYNNKAMQVGVSAQEVKAVLPEVIAPAPFDMDAENKSKSGENYMTVRYEKLVPLLIEAIKELKAEVEALKAAK